MKQLQRVIWSEGMFLTPEHFQACDRAAEQNLDFRFAASNFSNWGFTKLEINADKLYNGTFEILSAAGILPDGLAFSMPDSDPLPLGCDVGPNFPVTQKAADVWLAIPAMQSNGANVLLEDVEKEATKCRYRSSLIHINDENLDPEAAQPEPKAVPLGLRNFEILFSTPGEPPKGLTLLRMGQIKRETANKFILDEKHVPPCLDFASNSYLTKLLGRRVEKLTARSRKLAERRQPALSGSGFANVQDQLLLLAINSFLPGLKHLCNVRLGHPELAYLQLLNLAGALTSFSPLVDPAELPIYDHKDLGLRFAELDRIIDKLLDPPTREKCIEIPLEREGLFWIGNLDEERYFSGAEFFLGIKANMTVPDLIRAALRTKIGSRHGIDQLYRSAVNGVALQHESALPSICTAKAGYQYFRLNQTGPFWEEIRASGSIGIYVQAVVQPEVALQIALA